MPEQKEFVVLSVGELTNRGESGRGIIRIDTNTMKRLGIKEGDIVELQGQKKTGAIAVRAYPADVGLNIIRMDGITRKNAGIGVGETVKVLRAVVRDAERVVLAPAQKGVVLQMHPELLKKNLFMRPLLKGDIAAPFPVVRHRRDGPFDNFFGVSFEEIFFTPIPGETRLAVVSTLPEGITRVTELTEIELKPEAVTSIEEKIPTVTYEDIGGLGDAIIKIREMVELPLRHPELFTKLGIDPPKGVLLYGPPGTGKTLLAKAVANESGANFLVINGPEVMCVGPDTPILTKDKLIRAEDLFNLIKSKGNLVEKTGNRETVLSEGVDVYSLHDNLKIGKSKITEATKLEADSYTVETDEGTSMQVSHNQPFAIIAKDGSIGWKKAEELTEGDIVASVKEIKLDTNDDIEWLDKLDRDSVFVKIENKTLKLKNVLEQYPKKGLQNKIEAIKFSTIKSNIERANWIKPVSNITPGFSRFLGSMFAEGSITKDMDEVCFANKNEKFMGEIRGYIKDIFVLNGTSTKIRDIRLLVYSKALAHFLNRVCNLPLGKKEDLHVPEFLYTSGEENISAFISGYFDGDGTVSFGKGDFPTPRLYSIHKDFLLEVRGLLQLLGIPSEVTDWKTPINQLFALVVAGNDGRKSFYDKIFKYSIRNRRGKLSGKEMGEDTIPVNNILKEIKSELNLKYGKDVKESSIEPYISGRKELTRRKLREILNLFEIHGSTKKIENLKKLANSDIKFVKIKKLEKKDKSILYDFGVEGTSNFVGGLPFLLLHNSKWYGQSEANLRKVFEEAEKNAPSIIFIDEIDAIAPKREEVRGEVEKRVVSQLLTTMDGLKSRGKVIVIAATNMENSLDPALRRPGRFDREIEIGVPDVKGRKEILQIHTKNMPLERDVNLDELASITYGFTGADVQALAKESAMSSLRRVLPDISWKKQAEIPQDVIERLKVTKKDFQNALKVVEPSAMREVLIEVPNVRWSDIGGLEEIKESLKEVVQWPLKNPEAFERIGIKPPTGVLLYGPPGTGKTMLAKAVATESEANFIAIKGPEILSMWVGESEKRIREIFRKAKQVAPCIIFFDEIDSLAPRRGTGMGSHVMENIVSQILVEMSGLEELHNISIIAATNRPDILDPALLRPGRFERLIFVPPPDEKSRLEVLKMYTKNMPLVKEIDLKELSSRLEGYTGADIEALCREAGITALREDIKTKTVLQKHFETALERVKPTIDPKIMAYYRKAGEKLRKAKTDTTDPSYG